LAGGGGAAALVYPLAGLADDASNFADKATSYPLAAKVVFVVTLVLVLVAIFVYALLFPSDAEKVESPAPPEPS